MAYQNSSTPTKPGFGVFRPSVSPDADIYIYVHKEKTPFARGSKERRGVEMANFLFLLFIVRSFSRGLLVNSLLLFCYYRFVVDRYIAFPVPTLHIRQ